MAVRVERQQIHGWKVARDRIHEKWIYRFSLFCSSGSLLPELLGKPNENSFGAPDVAEPIRVLVLGHLADELRAVFSEPGEMSSTVNMTRR